MHRIQRVASVAFVVLLVLSLAGPANAESVAEARRRQAEARSKRAQIAAEIDALQASDREIDAAKKALDAQVAGQAAALSSARQAVSAAEASLDAAEAKLAETSGRIDAIQGAVRDRAVEAYIRPNQTLFAEFSGAGDIGEASRRRSLLEQVASHDTDLIDQLRALKEDQAAAQAQAQNARDVAASRKKAVDDKLSSLRTAQAQQARLAAALDARIKEFHREADLVAAEEAQLVALLQQTEAAERASRGGAPAIDTSGRVSGAGVIWPINGRVTSEFGPRWGRMHYGIDIGAGTGTPIRAAKAGKVVQAGWMGGYGNAIVIDHGGGFSTLYGHQSRLGSSNGQSVSQGQVIGYVGSTGNSTGPHLHFETRVSGSPRNPRYYLP